MSLRFKIIAVIGVILILLTLTTALGGQTLILDSLSSLEDYYARQDGLRVQASLSREISSFESVLTDWAEWDDTYNFMRVRDTEYLQTNLTSSTFINNRVEIVLLLDESGQEVYSEAFDLSTNKPAAVPDSLKQSLKTLSLKAEFAEGFSGFILLPGGPLMLAVHPILTSQGGGPARGTLVWGRFANSSFISQIAEQNRVNFSIKGMDDPTLDDQLRSQLAEPEPVLRKTDKLSTVYTTLPGIEGTPGIVFQVEVPRDIYQQARAGFLRLIPIFVGFSVLGFIIALIFLEKTLLSPIGYLTRKIAQISKEGTRNIRMKLPGRDELAILGNTLNTMLDDLNRAETEVAESEEKYRTLFEQTPDAVMLTTRGGLIIDANPYVSEVFGYSREELLYRNILSVYANKEDRTHFQEELEAKGSLENFEIRLRRKDGSELDALITAVLRRDATGAISGYQSITRDITPLKEMQRTLEIQYQKETEARQAVEAELKRRIEFTRALVHELKTPLTPVMASSELLGELAKDELTGKLSRNIFSGAQRLNERVNELLDLARGEIGILKVSPEVVDPTLILRQVADDIVPLCQRKKLAFSAAIPEALPWVKVDEERLRQVLLNLLNNAIASTPEGGKITLRATTDDSSLIVDVEDTGVGIPADQQSHLFSPYYRTESDRQRFSGLGLGLSLSKIIIQLHGGQIWVKSEPGKGSTFSFSIPLPNPSMEDSR